MTKEGIKDWDELQCYMIGRMETFLTSHGKMMIGWDEISKTQLQTASTVVSYRGPEFASYAANKGYKAVFTPVAAIYFD